MEAPRCRVCESELKLNGKYWVCPSDGFVYHVVRGKAGRPMWLIPMGEAAPEEVKKADSFEEWLAANGVTQEMFRDLDKDTVKDLKTAFYQRHSKNPDVSLLPPMR